MGMPRRKHANGHAAVGELLMSSLIFISLLLILNVSSPYRSPPTMAITTRSAISKGKLISRALVVTTATPVECYQDRRSGRLARSPQTSNINNHLAEINKPITCLDNVLEALQPSRNSTPNDPDDNLNALCDLTPQTNKSGRMTTLDLPTGVDVQDGALQAPANNVSPQASNVTDT
jgi:hypothetical protein